MEQKILTAPLYTTNAECDDRTATAEQGYVTDFREFLRTHTRAEADRYFSVTLQELYGPATARAIGFLLAHADLDVKLRFAHTYMVPETLACHVSADIVVEEARPEDRVTPNVGRYVISVRSSDGTKYPLRFAYQVSAIYYLMFLIDRKQKDGRLAVIDLARNKGPFVSLYHAVYETISHDDAQARYKQLLCRVADGRFRAGYKAKVECDIRRHLAQTFQSVGDSPVPYGMSRRRHLAVSADRIFFEGDARHLLYLQFI